MDFYIFDYMSTAKSDYAEFELVGKPARIEPPHCQKCGARLGTLLRNPPHKYQKKKGKPGDLITDGMVFAVSERFMVSYAKSSLSGLTFSKEPIQLFGSNLVYYMATPQQMCVLLDEKASGLVPHKVTGCDQCRVMSIVKFDRVVLREDTWHGEDVFLIACITQTMATERFVSFVNNHGFTNFQFRNPDDFKVDFSIAFG